MVVGDFAIELGTVVIGAGPGGYVAAIRAAQLGQKVAIIEKQYFGGTCLNVGCIPSKALISAGHAFHNAQHGEVFGVHTENVTLDFKRTQEWKQNEVVNKLTSGVEMLLKKNKVEIIRGEAFFVDDHTLRVVTEDAAQTYTFEHAIIATGSVPIEIPGFKFSERIVDSTGALDFPEVPKDLVVIGGGYIGAELAGAYANFGTNVTILEGTKQIIGSFEKDMVNVVTKEFKKKGVTVVTKAMAKSAEVNGDRVTVTYEVKDKTETVEADYVLVTVGRKPNTKTCGIELAGVEMDERGYIQVDKQGRTNVPHIFAIGDAVPGAALAHKASFEGKVAAEAISGQPSEVDYIGMPAVCFTDPELASVGLTLDEAKEKGYEAKASKFPLGGNGRALSLDAPEGFVRLVTEKETNLLLGAQVAGVGASDLIAELTLAIEAGMNAEDVASTVHAHPSLAEVIMDASELALGHPIHM